MMKNNLTDSLKKLMGYTEKRSPRTEAELIAIRTVRSLTVIGFESYDIWCIAEYMSELSLNAQEYPELFPPNQRLTGKQYLK